MNRDELRFRRLAGSYLRRHLTGLVGFGLFALICCVVFALYNLPVESVGYAAVLCAAVGAGLLAMDFTRYRRRCLALLELRSRVTVDADAMPAPADQVEALYQQCLEALRSHAAQLESEADAARSDMVEYYTLWAHQIKTPIAAMRLLLQEDGRENAALSAELFKVEQYVEMVLQYLRLGSMSSDLALRRCSLDGIVRQAVRKYAKLFILSKVALRYEPIDRTVLTDEKWLCFIVEQLLSNAVKYTPRGEVRVFLLPGAAAKLVVEDTGIGIRPEDLPRVFERGFTGYNGRADQRSTGIGLYLCRQIAGRLGHAISIESEPGRGTRVLLDLASEEWRME